jgi:hypothetical protein
MDPISTAIIAALVAGATAGVTEVGRAAISDAYKGLKTIIVNKFGGRSGLTQAITSLEDKPDSQGRRATLQEEVAEAQADRYDEILAAAKNLEGVLAAHGDVRIQKMLRSEGGEQIMRGSGGQQEQEMTDSPHGKQSME